MYDIISGVSGLISSNLNLAQRQQFEKSLNDLAVKEQEESFDRAKSSNELITYTGNELVNKRKEYAEYVLPVNTIFVAVIGDSTFLSCVFETELI